MWKKVNICSKLPIQDNFESTQSLQLDTKIPFVCILLLSLILIAYWVCYRKLLWRLIQILQNFYKKNELIKAVCELELWSKGNYIFPSLTTLWLHQPTSMYNLTYDYMHSILTVGLYSGWMQLQINRSINQTIDEQWTPDSDAFTENVFATK